jgi:hypothetical protein
MPLSCLDQKIDYVSMRCFVSASGRTYAVLLSRSPCSKMGSVKLEVCGRVVAPGDVQQALSGLCEHHCLQHWLVDLLVTCAEVSIWQVRSGLA